MTLGLFDQTLHTACSVRFVAKTSLKKTKKKYYCLIADSLVTLTYCFIRSTHNHAVCHITSPTKLKRA